MKRRVTLTAVSIALLLVGAGAAHRQGAVLQGFMLRKLTHTQGLFRGLLVNDADQVFDSANSLNALCFDESWNVLQSTEYVDRSNDLQRTLGAIVAAAKDKNLDAAALSYLQLTGQCFECHRYMRDRAPPR